MACRYSIGKEEVIGRLAAGILDVRLQRALQSLGNRWIVDLAVLEPFEVDLRVIEINVFNLEVQQFRDPQAEREAD